MRGREALLKFSIAASRERISAYSLNDKSEFNCHSGRERNQLSVGGMRGWSIREK